jgi:uncharacterized protein (TIGR02677 family)
MFAQLPDDASRHRLWRCAFGLTPARHLSVTSETLESPEFAAARPGTPWADAPPVAISARLRATGNYERPGPGSRVKDRTQAREFLADRARQLSRQTDQALEALAARTPARLSELGELGPDEFRLLLALLGDAVAALGDQAEAFVASSDGAVSVRIERAPAVGRATIRTAAGALTGPDHLIELAAGVAAR